MALLRADALWGVLFQPASLAPVGTCPYEYEVRAQLPHVRTYPLGRRRGKLQERHNCHQQLQQPPLPSRGEEPPAPPRKAGTDHPPRIVSGIQASIHPSPATPVIHPPPSPPPSRFVTCDSPCLVLAWQWAGRPCPFNSLSTAFHAHASKDPKARRPTRPPDRDLQPHLMSPSS